MVSCKRRLIREEDASAAVFFLMVGSAMLLLFLAVFNYGRYLMAERQVELALEASAVSVLSYYEPRLTRELGLYALDTLDASLAAKGKDYFVKNLGSAGSVNGQVCLDYRLEYPSNGRLSISAVLAAQAVDARRIEGWIGLGQDLFEVIGKTDWQNLMEIPGRGFHFSGETEVYGASEVYGTPYADGTSYMDDGYGDISVEDAPVEQERPAWLNKMESNAEADGSGRIRFWQFLSSRPPQDLFTDRIMPAAAAAAQYQAKYQLDEETVFWEHAFLNPASAVTDATFVTKMFRQVGEFLSVVKISLTGSVEKGINKLLFTEYLLGELDFATNKPVVDRYFYRCEAEYVLCGFDNAWDNLRNMALRLFLLRTCLHYLDSLMSMEIMDESALMLALIEGVMKGSADVEKLFAGERIPAFPWTDGVTMSYKDHLRLFLLCQAQDEQQTALQRLVQVNLWYWATGASSGDTTGNSTGASIGITGAGDAGAYTLNRFAAEIRVAAETELSLWPFGRRLIRREGVMGYDFPFTLLSQE